MNVSDNEIRTSFALEDDDRVLDEPTLSIPHPRMHERRFVLEPLAQLVPDLIHPVLKQTIARLLATLPVSLHHSPFIIQH